MHKDAQRKGKSTKNALPKTRGGEGAGGAAPGKERAAGGTSTDSTFTINLPPSKDGLREDTLTCLPMDNLGTKATAHQKAHLENVENMLADRALHYAAKNDKTIGEHAQNGAQRMYAGDPQPSTYDAQLLQAALEVTTPVLPRPWQNDLKPNWTPSRDRPKAVVAHQTPGVAFATPEGQAAFAEAIVEHEGIKPACAATGLTPAAVFLYAATHPEFRKVLNSALGANFESQVYKLDELCNKLLDMPPREMNQCANAYGRVFDYRMRIVGKLLPLIYGDQPGTQVNIQNNTGIVCNEATRERLIAINQKLLNVPTETKELEQ